MSRIPPELGSKVTSRDYSWMDMVQRAWGSEWNAPDHAIYQFSNGNRRDSTDKYTTGIYGVVPVPELLVSGHPYPDMRVTHLQSVGYGYTIKEPPAVDGLVWLGVDE